MKRYLGMTSRLLNEKTLFWLMLGLFFGSCFYLIGNNPLIADEGFHVPQVILFMQGKIETIPLLTVIPTYHAILACAMNLLGCSLLIQLRLISFLVSILGIYVFYRIVMKFWPTEAFMRTAQFAFLPFLFPLHFLIYTDGWSILMILLLFWSICNRQIWWATLISCMAILIRQPDLIWVGFALAYSVVEDENFEWKSLSSWKKKIAQIWPLGLPIW